MAEENEIPVITGEKQEEVGYKHPPKRTRFKPGQSGNPKGRPKGTSIKDRVRHYLENNPAEMEKFVAHFVTKNRELAWQMLEGKPKQSSEVEIDHEGLGALTEFFRAMAKGG
jgi:hypothetical protein